LKVPVVFFLVVGGISSGSADIEYSCLPDGPLLSSSLSTSQQQQQQQQQQQGQYSEYDGLIPRAVVQQQQPQEQQPPPSWLINGDLSRQDAEKLLKVAEGSRFLVRYSSNQQTHIISKYRRASDRFYHIVIRKHAAGSFQLQDSLDKNTYNSLDELVKRSSELSAYVPF
jgi:hypothetical protein